MNSTKTYPLWVSHSSMRDFISCPRTYFLRHIYKDPKSGKKINIINPALALGNTVHDVLESLASLKADERFNESLLEKFETVWEKVAGDKGGFSSLEEETVYKKRGLQMLQRVTDSPGPLKNLTVRLLSKDELPPRYMLSTEDNILLCGKIDWLEYFPEDDSVHIIDFKTGVHAEDSDSLQLPIYTLLVKNCQRRKIKKISYWYLEKDNEPQEMPLPDLEQAHFAVLEIARKVKQSRAERKFACPRNGCYACKPLEMIINGHARYIRTSGYQDIYSIIIRN